MHVVGDPSAGIQQVWVTYTGESGGAWHGKWQSLDLTQDADDSTLWTGSLAVPSGQQAGDGRFLVQAVNGVGLVGIDDNQGRYFIPGIAAGSATGAGTTLTLEGTYKGLQTAATTVKVFESPQRGLRGPLVGQFAVGVADQAGPRA